MMMTNLERTQIQTFKPEITEEKSLKAAERVGIFKWIISRGNLNRIKSIESKMVYYPFWFMKFQVEIFRMLKLPSRDANVLVAVDAIEERAGLLETKLEMLIRKEVEEKRILPHVVKERKAREIGEQFTRMYVERKFHPYKPPIITLQDIGMVYPPFYAVKSFGQENHGSYLVLINAINGEVKRKEKIN
ncbi:MAG: hypothetical protein HXS47_06450 [Theionarchaea archaeon]|nr:hypothetical protein [Theionarchaea archaeon]